MNEQNVIDKLNSQFRWFYASESIGGMTGNEETVEYRGLRESLISIAIAEKEQGDGYDLSTLKIHLNYQNVVTV